MPDRRWEVLYTLDGLDERRVVKATTPEHASWQAAIDLADRGFGGRIELSGVGELHG